MEALNSLIAGDAFFTSLMATTAIIVLVITFQSVFFKLFTKGIKLSLRVAVIGLPRSGKTTLITVVFDAIMSGRLARYASVSGLETVERLTKYLSLINSGVNLGPTTDEEVFAYRYVVNRKRFGIFSTKYDVEIADFPGEYSEELSRDLQSRVKQPSLFQKEFFSWIIRADRYIFVIDAEAYRRSFMKHGSVGRPDYVSEVEIAFKNAVLQLKQEMLDERVYERPSLFFLRNAIVFCWTRKNSR